MPNRSVPLSVARAAIQSGDYSVFRRPMPTYPVRRSAPTGMVIQHAVVRHGAQPGDMAKAIRAQAREAERAASQRLGEAMVKKAKELAPKSKSPVTGGQMAAGIRMVRVNQNTVEVAAPPPALWRIMGFPETGGLRPWLVKSELDVSTLPMVMPHVGAIDRYFQREMARDRETHRQRTTERIAQLEGAAMTQEQKALQIADEATHAGRALTGPEAAGKRRTLERQARELEEERRLIVPSLQELASKQATKRGLTRAEKREHAELSSRHQELSEQIMNLQQEQRATRTGSIVYPEGMEERLAQGHRHAEAAKRLRRESGFERGFLESLENPKSAIYRATSEGKSLRHAQQVVSEHTHVSLKEMGRGRRIPVLGLGDMRARYVTLQGLLQGKFRYPKGYNFLEAALLTPEIQALIEELEQQMAFAVIGERRVF